MYNYDFLEEDINCEFVNTLISFNDKELNVNILVTNKNVLVFRNIKENSVLAGREIHEIPEYELILKIDLNSINYEVDEDNTIIKMDNNMIIFYNFDLKKAQNN